MAVALGTKTAVVRVDASVRAFRHDGTAGEIPARHETSAEPHAVDAPLGAFDVAAEAGLGTAGRGIIVRRAHSLVRFGQKTTNDLELATLEPRRAVGRDAALLQAHRLDVATPREANATVAWWALVGAHRRAQVVGRGLRRATRGDQGNEEDPHDPDRNSSAAARRPLDRRQAQLASGGDPSADSSARLVHLDREPGVAQRACGGQAGHARADHHRVEHGEPT